MANNMSDYLEDQIRKHIFRTGSFTKPVFLYLALTSGVPTDSSTGAACGELNNLGAYARQALNPLDANWSADNTTAGTTYNNTAFTFPQATANWGWVSGCVIVDSGTFGTGNILYWGSLTNPRDVQNTDQFTVPISGVSVQND